MYRTRCTRQTANESQAMPKSVLERTIPNAGKLSPKELRDVSAKSGGVFRGLGPQIQRVPSQLTEDKLYCVYPEFRSRALDHRGRDSALRCPRPRRAVGKKCARRPVRRDLFRAYYGAGTAQRAIPTTFGVRVESWAGWKCPAAHRTPAFLTRCAESGSCRRPQIRAPPHRRE